MTVSRKQAAIILWLSLSHASAFGAGTPLLAYLHSAQQCGFQNTLARKHIQCTPRVLASKGYRGRAKPLFAGSGDGTDPGETKNMTAAQDSKFDPGPLRGLRPIGVDDRIEGIPQAPTQPANEYQRDTESTRGVGAKIGLEKTEGGDDGDEPFALSGRTPVKSGRDMIVENEMNLVNAFSSERGFLGAGLGVVALFVVYTSLYGGGGGSASVFGNYGAGAGAGAGAGPGKAVVTERFEEAYLCYGIPSPDDPNGCRDKRSVGPVRVFSRAPAPGAPDQAPDTN